MKKASIFLSLVAFASTSLVAQGEPISVGKPVYSSDGKRIGTVYRVTASGSVQVIIKGKLITIPASTITSTDGKYQTSLSKKEVATAS